MLMEVVKTLMGITGDFRGEMSVTQKTRSKTFPGVAQAMAQQWGGDMSG